MNRRKIIEYFPKYTIPVTVNLNTGEITMLLLFIPLGVYSIVFLRLPVDKLRIRLPDCSSFFQVCNDTFTGSNRRRAESFFLQFPVNLPGPHRHVSTWFLKKVIRATTRGSRISPVPGLVSGTCTPGLPESFLLLLVHSIGTNRKPNGRKHL